MRRNSIRSLTAVAVAFLVWAAAAQAQVPQPKLSSVSPCGAKAGTQVEVKITGGADLEKAEKLLFSHPGILSERVMLPADRFFPEPRSVEGQFKVTVGADVPPGVYEVRGVGYFGISNARRFVVGDRNEVQEKEPNNDVSQATAIEVGSTASGVFEAQNFDHYCFSAKKGQRIVVEAMALRLDSRAQVVVTLLDGAGRILRKATAGRSQDPVFDFTASEEGAHTLRVNDLMYRGGDEYFYRLTVRTGPWIDFVDPPVLQAGVETEVTLYGRNLPGGTPAEGLSLEKLAVKIKAGADSSVSDTLQRPVEAAGDFITYSIAGPDGRSNAVRLLVGDEPFVREAEPNDVADKAQKVTLPVQVVGRFGEAGDRDWVEFEAKKGEKLWIEVTSQRLGLPTDPSLVVQQVTQSEKGEVSVKDLAETDDQGTPMPKRDGAEKRYRMSPEDPGLLFAVPADGRYRVMVRDLYAQGDARFFYRLVIRAPRPDLRLVAFPVEPFPGENKMSTHACVLRRGGSERFQVVAFRKEGFDGPIRLEAEDLPPGVSARPVILQAPDQTSADFVIHAAPDAAGFAGGFRIVAKGEVGGKEIRRTARAAEVVWAVGDSQKDAFATRLTDRLALAVDDHFTAPFTTKLGEAKPYRMARGGKILIPVKLVKNADFKDNDKAQVKLTAVGIPGQPNQKPVVVKEVTLDLKKSEVEIEVDITEKALLGPMTFHLTGEVLVPFQRMPERIKAMEVDKKRVEKVTQEVSSEMKAAEAARSGADKKAQEAAQALAKAKAEMERASKAGEAEARAKAEAALKEAEAKAKAAEDEKAVALASEAKLKELIKSADTVMKKITDDSKKATDAAKEVKVKVWLASLPVLLDIVSAPLSLKAEPVTVKAADKVEAAVDAIREFGFADEFKLELQAPSGVGIKLSEGGSFAKDASQAKVTLTADKALKPGDYTVTLRAQIKFNGKSVTVDQPLAVKVEPATPAPASP